MPRSSGPQILIVQHVPNSDPPRFQVVRPGDGKTSEPAEIPSPIGYPVEGRPDSDLAAELHWYLERFLEYPFPPETEHAERVQAAMRAWGEQAFNLLFESRGAGRLYDAAAEGGYAQLHLQISSDDARILAWPWEALRDPEVGFLAHACRIERRLNRVRDPHALSSELPTDRINILLVIARPYKEDVRYRSLARPLVELIEKERLPAHVEVLRPPSFDALRRHLEEHPNHYHLLHFDGHGAYGVMPDAPGAASSPAVSPYALRAPEGHLIFENEDGSPQPVTAEQLNALLREHALPVVVLNACQSAMLDERAGDPFASVAAALLKSGMRSVVAMAYSVYVSAAQQFLPPFYRRLFQSGSVAEAVRAGRQQMFARKGRVCARGHFDLDDWLVPVLYQQEPLDLSFAREAPRAETRATRLPEDVRQDLARHLFIGRDAALLQLERALRRRPPAILISGLGGAGKTTLARGFLDWLDITHGLDGCCWISFIDVRNAEYVFNRMGEAFFGSNFLPLPMEEKLKNLTAAFQQHRLVVVWDNFESARGVPGSGLEPNLPPEDCELLKRFLRMVRDTRDTKGKVLITSRSPEDWLGSELRFRLSLGGLDGEERWEYCTALLDDLGLRADQRDAALVELMEYLRGHPLSMRIVLPQLESMSAAEVLCRLKSNPAPANPDGDLALQGLQTALRFIDSGLPDDLRPLLIPLSLHEGYVDLDYLEAMAKQVDPAWKREQIDRLAGALEAAGLLADTGHAIYEVHPVLTGYLRLFAVDRCSGAERDTWARFFAKVMGMIADQWAPRPLHEQRWVFRLFGSTFHHARGEAFKLEMDTAFPALTQFLAVFFQNSRNFDGATRLYLEVAGYARCRHQSEVEAGAYHQLGVVALECHNIEVAEDWCYKSLAISEALNIQRGAAVTYHQLGMVAYVRRDFARAEEWYRKSLEINVRLGLKHNEAINCNQLGILAQERQDLVAAEEWYQRSLDINLALRDEHQAGQNYHQLGNIARRRGDLDVAAKWYQESLAISERLGDERSAANTYHQLGVVAHELRNYPLAEYWYRKSLEIKEKQKNEGGAANTYYQLGMAARLRGDLAGAEHWCIKALVIEEKHGNRYGAAQTYNELGIIAFLKGQIDTAGERFIRCVQAFNLAGEASHGDVVIPKLVICLNIVSDEIRGRLEKMWAQAGLGDLPEMSTETAVRRVASTIEINEEPPTEK